MPSKVTCAPTSLTAGWDDRNVTLTAWRQCGFANVVLQGRSHADDPLGVERPEASSNTETADGPEADSDSDLFPAEHLELVTDWQFWLSCHTLIKT